MSAKRLNKSIYKAKETVDPQALIALSLDDIAVSLTELKNIQLDNQKLLANSYTLLAEIVTELREDSDEGCTLPFSGTVTTSSFVFIDTITSPEHNVKGFSVQNDGPNSIYVGFNVTKAGLEPMLSDITSNLSRFREVKTGEEIRFIFNRRKIENVAFIATVGPSLYRGWLVW